MYRRQRRLDDAGMDSTYGTSQQLAAGASHQPGTGASQLRSGLRPLPDELDQVARLARFRTAHPEVIIGDGGFGTIQARIPELNGETVITRYTLRELLDKLGELRP
jgi:hypothetical protein